MECGLSMAPLLLAIVLRLLRRTLIVRRYAALQVSNTLPRKY
jgi:hypothetical protein